MQIFNTVNKLTSFLKDYRNKNIGLIPTMGSLHEGHLSLITKSIKVCDITICSVFVNPKQFNSLTDLENYPREIEKDIHLLEKQKCDILFYPNTDEMYSKNEKVKQYNFGSAANIMEGKYRPGHFDGVATIVEKLLTIIKPNKAFFGNKDLQQLYIIKKLVTKIGINVEIVGMPTIREVNGLAKSSRNILLSKEEKKNASILYSYLIYCKKNKSKSIEYLKKYMYNIVLKNSKIELEYLEFISIEKMQKIEEWQEKNKNAICLAAYIGGVRLIDNIIL